MRISKSGRNPLCQIIVDAQKLTLTILKVFGTCFIKAIVEKLTDVLINVTN